MLSNTNTNENVELLLNDEFENLLLEDISYLVNNYFNSITIRVSVGAKRTSHFLDSNQQFCHSKHKNHFKCH